MMTNPITIQTTVRAPLDKVWQYWNQPEHISNWAFASSDWEAPSATNDLRAGGKFTTRMQSKDGKEGFDFEGVYDQVKENELIEYTMSDGRQVTVAFSQTPQGIVIIQSFEPESQNSLEMQQQGWQAILDNFKKYTEKEIS